MAQFNSRTDFPNGFADFIIRETEQWTEGATESDAGSASRHIVIYTAIDPRRYAPGHQ